MAVKPVVYDDTTKKHRPLGSGEKMDGLSASSVISSQSGNLIAAGSDGLAYLSGSGIADMGADNLLEAAASGRLKLTAARIAEWLDGHPQDAAALAAAIRIVSADAGNAVSEGSDGGAYLGGSALADALASLSPSQMQEVADAIADGSSLTASGGKLSVADVSSGTSSAGDGSALRPLSDRFGDSANVKDFGAVGDGVADDTAAFEAAAASGRPVFVPEGTYRLARKVDGYFWSDVPVAAPYVRVWCERFYRFQPGDFACGAAMSAGGDFPNLEGYASGQWDRASQAPGFDVIGNVLYIPGLTSSGATHVSAVRWSENPSERVLLSRSPNVYALTGHQSMGVYRMSKDDPVVLVCAVNCYVSDGVRDDTRNFTVGFFSYDWRSGQPPALIRTMEAFTASDASALGLSSTALMNVSVSPDGAAMVASAAKTGGGRIARVWDMHAVMMGLVPVLATGYQRQFETDSGAGQGIWTDGRYMYTMSNASAAASYSSGIRHLYLAAWSFDGIRAGYCYIDTTSCENGFFGNDAAIAEVEGVFLAPWHGELVPVVLTSFMRYINGADTYTRYNRYALPTVASYTSERIVARNLVLQGELIAEFQTALGTNSHQLATQRVLFYSPAGNGDVNVGLGSNSGLFVGAGECMDMVRAQMQSRAISGQGFTNEALKLLADGRVVIHAGANSESGELFFEESGRLPGLHLNNANNFILLNDAPLMSFAYSGFEKGTAPESAKHSVIAFSTSDSSLSNDYYLATLYNYISTTGENRLTLYVHDETTTSSDGLVGLQCRCAPGGTSLTNYMQGDLLPWNGNTFNIGADENRWDNGFFHTSVAADSDARVKQQIEPLGEAERRAALACKGLIRKYKFNEAVERKGGGARLHVGVVAQELKAAFEAEGLDAERYGILCHASWDDEYEDRVVREDENGAILETERVLVRSAGDGYSIRYEELLCFIIAAL